MSVNVLIWLYSSLSSSDVGERLQRSDVGAAALVSHQQGGAVWRRDGCDIRHSSGRETHTSGGSCQRGENLIPSGFLQLKYNHAFLM